MNDKKKIKRVTSFKSHSDFLSDLQGIVEAQIGTMELAYVKDFVSTSVPALDLVMGNGVPLGHVVVLQGAKSVGKTTICLMVARNAIEKGYRVLWVETEKLSAELAVINGLDPAQVDFVRPRNLESAVIAIERGVEATNSDTGQPLYNLIVYDGFGAGRPDVFNQVQPGQGQIGVRAKILTYLGSDFTTSLKNKNIAFLATDQVRANIEMMSRKKYTDSMPHSVKHATSIIVNLQTVKRYKSGSGESVLTIGETGLESVSGQRIRFDCVNNSIAPMGRVAECDIIFENSIGFDKSGNLADIAILHNHILRKGAWYSMVFALDVYEEALEEGIEPSLLASNNDDLIKIQGASSVADWLRENTEMQDKLWSLIKGEKFVSNKSKDFTPLEIESTIPEETDLVIFD